MLFPSRPAFYLINYKLQNIEPEADRPKEVQMRRGGKLCIFSNFAVFSSYFIYGSICLFNNSAMFTLVGLVNRNEFTINSK